MKKINIDFHAKIFPWILGISDLIRSDPIWSSRLTLRRRRRSFSELSDRALLRWCEKSGIHRPKGYQAWQPEGQPEGMTRGDLRPTRGIDLYFDITRYAEPLPKADAFLSLYVTLCHFGPKKYECWNMLKWFGVIWIPKYVQVMDQQLFSFSDVSKIKHFYSKTSPLSSMHLASFSLQMPSDCWFPPCFLPIALAPFKFYQVYICVFP